MQPPLRVSEPPVHASGPPPRASAPPLRASGPPLRPLRASCALVGRRCALVGRDCALVCRRCALMGRRPPLCCCCLLLLFLLLWSVQLYGFNTGEDFSPTLLSDSPPKGRNRAPSRTKFCMVLELVKEQGREMKNNERGRVKDGDVQNLVHRFIGQHA